MDELKRMWKEPVAAWLQRTIQAFYWSDYGIPLRIGDASAEIITALQRSLQSEHY
jgi:hypothetical protein